MALAKALTWQAPVCVQAHFGANGAIADGAVFIAEADYEVLEVAERHGTAGSDNGDVTMDVKKVPNGTAVGSGTSVLASTFDMKSTADTLVRKNRSNGGLSTTASALRLAAGDALALDFTGTLTALAGVGVTIWVRRVSRPSY